MANKSFVVQYLIKARDQFSAAADDAAGSVKNLRKQIGQAKKDFQGFRKQTEWMRKKGAILSAAVTAPIVLMGFSLKNAARDAQETRSKFGTVFRDMRKQSQDTANALAKDYGLSGNKARQLLGDTGDLLTGFGFTQEEALKTSESVNKLAVDLASFTNFSGGAEGASAALTKALLGERESLKSLGVAISEENVKTKIAQMLAEGQTFSSMRQAKARATLALAYEQSKNAVGDFARTSQDLANQERILGSRLEDLKVSIGELLLPAALKVTQALRGLVEMFLEISPATKKAILITAGLAAVVGPVLLAVGSLVMLWPLITSGAALFGAVAVGALGPMLPIIAGVALGAALIVSQWGKLKTFFAGFAQGLKDGLGPALSDLMGNFKELAAVVGEMFGKDGEATKNLMEFSNVGQLVGQIVGDALRTLINGLSGVGELLGQLVAATVNLDFSEFDTEKIKAEFLGTDTQAVQTSGRVDVGVNVGLAEGLQETGAATVSGTGVRSANVGAQ